VLLQENRIPRDAAAAHSASSNQFPGRPAGDPHGRGLAFLGFLCALHGAVPREVRTYGFGGMALEAVVLSQPQQQGSTIAWGVAPWQRALEWPLLGSGGGGGIEWRMLIRLIVDAAA